MALLNALSGLLANVAGGSNGPGGSQTAQQAGTLPTMAPINVTQDPSYSGSIAPTQAAPAAQQQTTPDPGTDVGAVTVQAAKPPLNYDNTNALSSVDQSLDQEAAYRQANPRQGATSYGILPPDMQHGTLSKVLGLLGDAYLVHHGRAPAYLQAQQAQTEGDAMAGMSQNPQAAAERVAATGVPGATELSDKIYQQANQQALQKQIQQQNFQYKASMINDRNQGVFNRQAPVVMGAVQGIQDPTKYGAMYNLWDQRAKSVDPNADASSAYGIPKPEDWQPGTLGGYGMTSNNQQVSEDKASQRAQSGANAQTAAGARIQSAGIMAGSRQPSTAGMNEQILQKVANGTATLAEQAYYQKIVHTSGGAARTIPGAAQQGGQLGGGIPIAMAGPGNPVANGGRPLTAAQSHTLPPGVHYLGADGKWRIR